MAVADDSCVCGCLLLNLTITSPLPLHISPHCWCWVSCPTERFVKRTTRAASRSTTSSRPVPPLNCIRPGFSSGNLSELRRWERAAGKNVAARRGEATGLHRCLRFEVYLLHGWSLIWSRLLRLCAAAVRVPSRVRVRPPPCIAVLSEA